MNVHAVRAVGEDAAVVVDEPSSRLGGGGARLRAVPELAVPARAPVTIRFGTFADLERLPVETPSLWKGFLPRGSLTLLWGEAKSGKSTLLAGLLKAVEAGEPFLGRETRPATALWLSEEPEQALREKGAAFGLFGLESSVVGAAGIYGVGWENLIEQSVARMKSRGHELLIVDTFTGLAGLDPEEENDAGAVASRLRPLKLAAADGHAILVVHHANKNGRKSPRGSGAFSGLVDTLISFRRRDPQSKRFSLSTVGRYTLGGQLDGALTVTEGGWSYRLLDSADRGHVVPEGRSADVILWDALPLGDGNGRTYMELAEATDLTVDQVEARLRAWRARERSGLGRIGRGVKGAPFRWFRTKA